MSNTPFAYAVCSVLHRSVEFKPKKRPSLVFNATSSAKSIGISRVWGNTTALLPKLLPNPSYGVAFFIMVID